MFISDESNMIQDDSANHPITRPNRSGSMNPNLIPILIVIGIVQVLLIGHWVFPRAASLYYQTRGGQVVDRVLSGGNLTQWDSIACASPPAARDSTRENLLKAIEDLNRAIRFSPESAHPQLLLGRAYCMLEEPENAIEAYQAYVDLRPANPLGHLELGFAYEAACEAELRLIGGEERGRPEQQRCHIPEYQEPMIASWKEAGLSVQDFIDTGEMARVNGRINDALKWFRRGSEYSPDSGAPWFFIGQIYEDLERPNISLNAYLSALELGYTPSVDKLAKIYATNGDYEAFVTLLTISLERFIDHPERQTWWSQLGEHYRGKKDWESAIQTYKKASSEFPEDPDFYISLGLSYYEGGQGIDKAEEELSRAIEIDPENGTPYYTLARLLVREKRYSEADSWFELALEKNPSANWWQLARGTAARDAGNLTLAQEQYQAIIDRAPTFDPAYFEISLVYYHMEQPEEAVKAIEQAVELMKTPVLEYYMRAALIYEWIEDIDKAVEAYTVALTINPQNQRASERMEKLISGDN